MKRIIFSIALFAITGCSETACKGSSDSFEVGEEVNLIAEGVAVVVVESFREFGRGDCIDESATIYIIEFNDGSKRSTEWDDVAPII